MLQAIVFRMNGSWDFHRGSWAWIMADHVAMIQAILGPVGHPGSMMISRIHRIDDVLMDPSDRRGSHGSIGSMRIPRIHRIDEDLMDPPDR